MLLWALFTFAAADDTFKYPTIAGGACTDAPICSKTVTCNPTEDPRGELECDFATKIIELPDQEELDELERRLEAELPRLRTELKRKGPKLRAKERQEIKAALKRGYTPEFQRKWDRFTPYLAFLGDASPEAVQVFKRFIRDEIGMPDVMLALERMKIERARKTCRVKLSNWRGWFSRQSENEWTYVFPRPSMFCGSREFYSFKRPAEEPWAWSLEATTVYPEQFTDRQKKHGLCEGMEGRTVRSHTVSERPVFKVPAVCEYFDFGL